MAFNLDYMARVSTSGNTNALKVWSYNGTATGSNEAVATIVASAYFNGFQQNLTSGYEAGPLKVGDVIHVHGNDANGMYVVTSITTNVTVGSYAAIGTVNTANIADGAVTSVKLEAPLIHYVRVPVTLANFIASNTTPVEILAAPGAGLKYMIHRANLGVDYGGTVLANGGTVQLTYGAASGDAASICTNTLAAATLIAATADTNFGFSPVNTTLTEAKTVNKAVSLSAETADFTGGTGSTYEVDVWYSTVPLV